MTDSTRQCGNGEFYTLGAGVLIVIAALLGGLAWLVVRHLRRR